MKLRYDGNRTAGVPLGGQNEEGVMSKAAYYGKVFIGGEWQEATGGKRRDVINPANGKVIGSIAAGTTTDIDRAAQAAKAAFDSGVWSGLPGRERSRILPKSLGLHHSLRIFK